MGRIPSLTRREALAVAGIGAFALVCGEGLAATEAVNHPVRPADAAEAGAGPTLASTHPTAPDAPAAPSAADGTSADSQPPASLSYDDLPWYLRLISKSHPLPEDFPAPTLRELPSGYAVDERIYDDLVALMEAAAGEGVEPVVCSAYRTHDKQQDLYQARVRRSKSEGKRGQKAKDDAAFWVAPPYAGEHEAGLAVDLVDGTYQELDEAQETTDTQRWLIDHCADHGFILRYPTDKSAVTGIGYEPWHYRYVGKEAASAITASGLCLEEWLDQYLSQGNK